MIYIQVYIYLNICIYIEKITIYKHQGSLLLWDILKRTRLQVKQKPVYSAVLKTYMYSEHDICLVQVFYILRRNSRLTERLQGSHRTTAAMRMCTINALGTIVSGGTHAQR